MDEKKVREAIEVIKGYRRLDEYMNNTERLPYCDMAIEALEKQLPKKVEMRTEYRDINGELVCFDGFCPSCGNTVNSDRNKSCNRCGQKLDWPE